MLSKSIEKCLNRQIELEFESSQYYLSMASWAQRHGYTGITSFLYLQSDEERSHMLKLFHFVNDRGGHAVVPALSAPIKDFESVKDLFQKVLDHEQLVSREINELVDACLKEKDYATHNFLQWYVAEQIEEEKSAQTLLDKLSMIGNDKGGLYLFDRDLEKMKGGADGGAPAGAAA
jgi:ferritin